MAVEVVTKKWGNSIGIVIPKNLADKIRLKPKETVLIEIERKQNVLRELFGAIQFKEPTEKILRDTRKELESKWMR
jgi:antitoxin component of MazEF toxin-antitoxin module